MTKTPAANPKIHHDRKHSGPKVPASSKPERRKDRRRGSANQLLVDGKPAPAESVVGSSAPASAVTRRTRIAQALKRRAHDIEHFGSPVLAGLLATAFLAAVDSWHPLAGQSSRAISFILSSLKHVHVELVLAGLLLLAVCCALIGSPVARWVRRLVVLPLVQLAHHVFLVGAGVLVAASVGAFATETSGGTLAGLGSGVFFLLVGGAELQAAESVCRLSDKEMGKHLPIPTVIATAALAAVAFGWLLVRQLGTGH